MPVAAGFDRLFGGLAGGEQNLAHGAIDGQHFRRTKPPCADSLLIRCRSFLLCSVVNLNHLRSQHKEPRLLVLGASRLGCREQPCPSTRMATIEKRMDRHARFGAVDQRPDQIIDDETFGAEVDGNQCLVLTIHLLLAGVRHARSMTRVVNGHDVAGHRRIDQLLNRSHDPVERRLLIGQDSDQKLSVCKKLGPLLGVVHATTQPVAARIGINPDAQGSSLTHGGLLQFQSCRSGFTGLLQGLCRVAEFDCLSIGWAVPTIPQPIAVGTAHPTGIHSVELAACKRPVEPPLQLEPCPKTRSKNRGGSCPRATPLTSTKIHTGHRMKRFSRRSLHRTDCRFTEQFSQPLTLFTETSAVLHNRRLGCCPV